MATEIIFRRGVQVIHGTRSPFLLDINDSNGDVVDRKTFCGEICARGTEADWWPGYESGTCEYCAACGHRVTVGTDCEPDEAHPNKVTLCVRGYSSPYCVCSCVA